MTKNSPTLAVEGETVGKRARVACSDCKAKKKRCLHRDGEGGPDGPPPAATPRRRRREDKEKTEMGKEIPTEMQVSSDEDEKPVVKKSRRGRRPKPAAAPPPAADVSFEAPRALKKTKKSSSGAPKMGTATTAAADPPSSSLFEGFTADHPADDLEGSMTLSIHTVMSRELQKRMEDLEAQLQITQKAMEDTLAAGAAVQEIMQQWVETWKNGL